MQIYLLLVALILVSLDVIHAFNLNFLKNQRLFSLKSSENSDNSLWRDRVQYVDVGSLNIEDNCNEQTNTRELPLFLLGAAFFPSGKTALNVFEMKYRTMMFDISQIDDCFGYIHTEGGRIASVGTLCKVVNRELLEDGRQLIELEGKERFFLKGIKKTLPYMIGEVVSGLTDDQVEEEIKAQELEKDVWRYVKYYLRLMRAYEPNAKMVVSRATKEYRPTTMNAGDHNRRTAFSFSVANMIQMTQARESQLLLQTTDIMKRLDTEKAILVSASEMIAEQLVQMNIITEEQQERFKQESFMDDDDDSEILPPDDNSGNLVDVDVDPWSDPDVMQ